MGESWRATRRRPAGATGGPGRGRWGRIGWSCRRSGALLAPRVPYSVPGHSRCRIRAVRGQMISSAEDHQAVPASRVRPGRARAGRVGRPRLGARLPRRSPLRALTPLGVALCTLTLISCMSAPAHSGAARRSDGQPADAGQSSAAGHSAAGAAASRSSASSPAAASPDALPTLTPAQMAGQRVIYSYTGLEPPAALLNWIRHGQVGGVIFFGGNISSRAQIAGVIKRAQPGQRQPAEPHARVPAAADDRPGGRPGPAPARAAAAVGEADRRVRRSRGGREGRGHRRRARTWPASA